MFSGFAHFGVSTHIMEDTSVFYCNILECKLIADEIVKIYKSVTIRQASINRSLASPAGMNHNAFKVDSLEDLINLSNRIEASGMGVSEITDLDYIKSIFFQNSNCLQLEVSDIGSVTEANDASRSG